MDKHDNDYAITRDSLYGTTPEPTYAGITSFMRRKYTRDLTGVDVAVTGIPLDTATTNRPGARFGPRAIRNASSIMAWEKPYGMEFDPFDKLAVADVGDCMFDFGRPETVPDEIEEHAWNIINEGPGLLSLGGDHFIAYPVLKAHARKFGAPLSLLHFDAHSDTWADTNDRIDHGTMFYWAAKHGIVDPATSVQIGLRTTNPDTMGFNVLDAPWVHQHGIEAVMKQRERRSVTGRSTCHLISTASIRALLRAPARRSVVGLRVTRRCRFCAASRASILLAWTWSRLRPRTMSAKLPRSQPPISRWKCCICLPVAPLGN